MYKYNPSVPFTPTHLHLDKKAALAEPVLLPQSPDLFATLKSTFFFGKNATESGIRRDYAVQTVFHGAIENHFSVLDTSRLWEKGCLCFLYARGCGKHEIDRPHLRLESGLISCVLLDNLLFPGLLDKRHRCPQWAIHRRVVRYPEGCSLESSMVPDRTMNALDFWSSK